ncbi:DUF1801 domain-containing protein [Luteimonas aestuarii]|uniref:DUF1801 domain-containing protein n=1 Tax=Luteimonas aestuarii TaxID=453837 RepID=A0A4R5TMD1_9GAMM|nr:DUF1801 domain-containing protein [Luteimonas aestuarii]TDK23749.1 DUF1801 domain-containing protein [Luteimonas aestuarii]
MATRHGTARHATRADTSAAVDAFMASLDDPRKPQLQVLREAILAVDPAIAEGIKWNAPSFRTDEYFATFNLRGKAGLMLILHLGAKARDLPAGGLDIEDPQRLLTWLGNDRAQVVFADAKAVDARIPTLRAILRQWIGCV